MDSRNTKDTGRRSTSTRSGRSARARSTAGVSGCPRLAPPVNGGRGDRLEGKGNGRRGPGGGLPRASRLQDPQPELQIRKGRNRYCRRGGRTARFRRGEGPPVGLDEDERFDILGDNIDFS